MTSPGGNSLQRSLFLILPLLITPVIVEGRKHLDDFDNDNDSGYGGYNEGGDRYDENVIGNDNYGEYGSGDERPIGGDGYNPDNEAENAHFNANANAFGNRVGSGNGSGNENPDSNSNGIKWISPLPGDILPSGKSMTVTWSSNNPSYSPSFSLCTSNPGNQGSDCGNENWPVVTNNQDGTFSTTVTMPVISQSIEKLYLSMNNNNGDTFNSPVFGVQGDSGAPNAYLASPVNPTSSISTTLPTATGIPTESTDIATNTPTMVTPQTGSTKVKSAIAKSGSTVISPTTTIPTALSISSPLPIHTSITPQQVQAPLQASIVLLSTPLPIYTSAPSNNNIAPTASSGVISAANSNTNSRETSTSNQPNIKAIALPISICGLILLASLIFCARSKRFRKTGLGKDVESNSNNWQDVIKQKAALASQSQAHLATKGVEVKEKVLDDGNGMGVGVVPTLGYKGRQNSNDSSQSYFQDKDRSRNRDRVYDGMNRRDEDERFTEIPRVDYERRGSRGIHGRRERERDHTRGSKRERERERGREHRHRHRNHRESSYSSTYPERYRNNDSSLDYDYSRSNSQARDYYSISRKSSGGIGGVYDDFPTSRDYVRSSYHTPDTYSRTNSRELLESKYRSSRDDHPIFTRSSTRDELYTPPLQPYTSFSRDRQPESRSTRPSILSQHNDSYVGPLSNPFDQHQHQHTTRLGGDQKRPLPEPIIRTSTNTSNQSRSSSNNIGNGNPDYDRYGIPTQKSLPHLTGGLRDDDYIQQLRFNGNGRTRRGERGREKQFESDTEAGWDMDLDLDLANQGRYTTGNEGMGELYEDLRRAIQRG